MQSKLQSVSNKLYEESQEQKKYVQFKEGQNDRGILLPKMVDLSEIEKTNESDLSPFRNHKRHKQRNFFTRVTFKYNHEKIT